VLPLELINYARVARVRVVRVRSLTGAVFPTSKDFVTAKVAKQPFVEKLRLLKSFEAAQSLEDFASLF
jgi:hypothetical protein